MDISIVIVGCYGLFTLIGGLIGYLKARSRASLTAGTISGLLLVACAYWMRRGEPMAWFGSLAIALALGLRFFGTWRKKRRLMPDLLMVMWSIAVLVVVGLRLLRS